jgi:L-malate glycosyltransferase
MHVFVILKCGLKDSFSFLLQIIQNDVVDSVTVFRDTPGLQNSKVTYVQPTFKIGSLFKQGVRLLQILTRKKLCPKIIIGIYELPHGLLALLAGKFLNIPSVVSIIGNPSYSKLRRGIRMKVTMWILKHCDFITVTGSKSKKYLENKGIMPNKIFILPNTIDFAPFNPLNIEKEYDIISLGRISSEKHLEVFIKVIIAIMKEKPNVKAAIGGTGPQMGEIADIIRNEKLESTIDIKGYVPEEELELFFNKGKVFLLTSETEGFPRTIVQAAACGVPIVAANVGDISDIIEHDSNGFLVNDYYDIDDYADKVNRLLEDKVLSEKFSAELNIKVRKSFVTKNATIVWKEIFDKV